MDTIFALSSGQPPAAIAIVRISGPAAITAITAMGVATPVARRPSLVALRHPHTSELLDRGLVLWFPGPSTATGEDLAELHLHGGRAIVAGVLGALAAVEGLRPAAPGEFTRRAFLNGRIDLAEAEGLADLLLAETEAQRRAALALVGGSVSRKVNAWQDRLLALSARMEAVLDFSDEGEVGDDLPEGWLRELKLLADEIGFVLSSPPLERLRDGIRVVAAGPPNAGKSTLINALAQRDAAIVSPVPGTTRDIIEVPVSIAGVPFLLIDTAGLREAQDAVEAIGVDRAHSSIDAADIILWLGDPLATPDPERAIVVAAKADLGSDLVGDVQVSAFEGTGLDRLTEMVLERAGKLLPREGEVAVNARHRAWLEQAWETLEEASIATDPLIIAELLRSARAFLDGITGRAGVEDMLDSLFAGLCIGK
jgi:tRNA modification GTPase